MWYFYKTNVLQHDVGDDIHAFIFTVYARPLLSHHIMPLVINALRGGHADT